MCMKYVNATISFFTDVITRNDIPVSYSNPFEGLKVSSNNLKIGDFCIVVNINILGTDDKNVTDNILNNREKVEATVRLTKCSSNPDERMGKDLSTFIIDTKERNDLISHACYDFLNFTQIITVNKDDILLEHGLGKYVVKVLITDPKSGKKSIQAMRQLNIESLD